VSFSTFTGIANPFASPNPGNAAIQKAKQQQALTNKALGAIKITPPAFRSDFPNGFQIFEIVNDQVPTNPTISLIENRMPKNSLAFGGEQHIVKDYYPGNSEPVTHVLGPRESDIMLNGRMYDKKYKDPAYYGASYALAQVIDGIRLRGNLCKFVMGPWQRYGYVMKTDFPMKRLGDIDYHIDLLIVGFNLPKNAYFVDNNNVPFDINRKLLAITQAFVQANTFTANLSAQQAALKANAPQSLFDELNSGISNVATQINKVTNFVDSVFKAGQNLLNVVNRAKGLILNAQRAISQYKRQLGALKLGVGQLGTGIGNQTIASQATGSHRVSGYILSQVSSSQALAANLSLFQDRLAQIAKTVPLARVRVNQGDTLQKIAAKYYGDATQYQAIYSHNNLRSTQLTPGQVLELPRI
jgi:LysM repeat protein